MNAIAVVVFWISAVALLHAYLLYPAILAVWTRWRGVAEAPVPPADDPTVALIIAAHNEASVIRARIENALALEYAAGRLQILIASDGSSDATVAIATEYAARGVSVAAFEERRGKAATLQRALERTRAELVVFSDANTHLAPDAVHRLARWFGAADVGAVCGELRIEPASSELRDEGRYWSYEQRLKAMESALGTALGANGGLYAVRRNLIEPIPDDLILDDFVIPMRLVEKGYRIAYDREAVGREDTAPDESGEFRRRVRIGAGGFQAMSLLRRLMDPRRGFVSFAFLSHKVLRWLSPLLLLALFLTARRLRHAAPYSIAFELQAVGYFAVAVDFALMRLGWSSGPLRSLRYFVVVQVALGLGGLRWLLGRQGAAWERTARHLGEGV